ncbi:1-deoxy-D-xylulose-5-phosphate synthase N-terminal domain-containing protein [Candidatus Pelagibacter sp. HIMB1521]|uniref:1-deoxy-D-xylulose-5-phosphate synthase N-terminal domain-containing protein n=1 Tax=Candidatus Pelagibacter sp. HIMB1521 TaxID=3413344 RepID=UPI003F845928
MINKKNIYFIEKSQIDKVLKYKLNNFDKAKLLSLICRLNTLSMIKLAGSGHLGTSMSAMDIMVWIKFFFQKKKKLSDPNRDIFFSSKGHDAPALYSVLYALGVISLKKILKLRRLEGLEGHPDIATPGIEANTGSLGMGISKAKGMVWAKNYNKNDGSVIVLTGDGELQEGQIFESMQTTSHQKINNLIVIVDHNKIQSSQYVKNIIDLLDLKKKFQSFGWHVEKINGHNFRILDKKLKKLIKIKNKPKIIIADTIKGRGIKEMEHPNVMKKNKKYNWHAGAPDDKNFFDFQIELIKKINFETKKKIKTQLKILNILNIKLKSEVLEIH